MDVNKLQIALQGTLSLAKKSPILFNLSNKVFNIVTYNEGFAVKYSFDVEEPDTKLNFVLDSNVASEMYRALDTFVTFDDSSLGTIKITTKGTVLTLPVRVDNPIDISKINLLESKPRPYKVMGSLLKSSINYTSHCANDKSIGDSVMKSYRFNIQSDNLQIMTTNGYMMSVINLDIINTSNQDVETVVNKELGSFIDLLFDSSCEIGFIPSKAAVFSNVDTDTKVSIVFVSSLTKGNMQPYQSLIENFTGDTDVNVNRRTLETALKRSSFFMDGDKQSPTYLIFEDNYCTINSSNQYGDVSNKIETDTKMENKLEIKINGLHLHNFLKTLPSNNIKFIFPKNKPFFFVDVDGLMKEVISYLS